MLRVRAVRCVILTNVKRGGGAWGRGGRGGEKRGGGTQLHYCVSAPDSGSGPSSHQSPDTVCHRDKCCSLLNVISSLRL